MFDAHAQKNILIVMLQIFDNLFHYKNIVTVQWIKYLKLCMVTMATLPPAKELKIQVVSWQNEIRTLDVLKSPTWFLKSLSIVAKSSRVSRNRRELVADPSQFSCNYFGTRHICEIIKTKLRINCGINETLRDNIASKLN